MSERPILFSAPMIRALLAGTKTQTRRAVKFPRGADACNCDHPRWREDTGWFCATCGAGVRLTDTTTVNMPCPYGAPGDLLWVREKFSGPWCLRTMPPSLWLGHMPPIWFWADGDPTHGDWTRPKPSIHMPRWASRITLEITDVRVERLNDCSEADARAEGVRALPLQDPADPSAWWEVEPGEHQARTPVDSYRKLWEHINGPGSWDANPWVWALEFGRAAA